MRTMLFAIAIGVLTASVPALAQTQSCTATAVDKKLSGAAKNSFMSKCQNDTAARCDQAAAEKKLAGAAKTSFTTKCVKDGVGA